MIKWLTDNPQAAAGFAAATVALLGVLLTFVSLIMTGQQNKAQIAAMKEDREAARLQFEAQREAMKEEKEAAKLRHETQQKAMKEDRETARLQHEAQREAMLADREAAQTERKIARDAALSDRFARAINLLKSDSLHIRMGALFELKKLGLEMPEDQESIVRILGPFIREGIENAELLELPSPAKCEKWDEVWPRPKDDIFISGEIVSLFNEQITSDVFYVYLRRLEAEKLYLRGLQLRRTNLFGANFQESYLYDAQLQKTHLIGAQFQGANLVRAQFQGANLQWAQLQGANLYKTDLRGAIQLDAEQLLYAKNVEQAHLDDKLRTEYDRLKAEQDKTNQEA